MMVQTNITGGVATLTLDSPPLNILTRAALREIREAFAQFGTHADLRVVVITANGKHFSVGADVAEHLPPQDRELIPEFVATVEAIASFPQPVIAAVRGRCLGGGFEVVQAADMAIAGESAQFGQPEIVLGVTAPAACVMLPRRTAPGMAAELLFTGDSIDARRAKDAGLVLAVVPDERVDDEAQALAARIARHSAATVRYTKRTIRDAEGRARAEALKVSAETYTDVVMRSNDALEGLVSFIDKRTPQWRHR